MNWEQMSYEVITSGKSPEGLPLLQLFLIDYKKIFHVQTVNPACPSCLKNYYNEYKNKFLAMENKSRYQLHKKRENLPLKFGSPIVVNNTNITDEYAEILLERYKQVEGFKIEDLFSKFPTQEEKENKEEVINVENTITQSEPKQNFQKKKKRR